MKSFIYVLIALTSLSCSKVFKNDYYVRMTDLVEISHVDIPDTIDNMAFAQKKANAQAPDDCWSNLSFSLTKNFDFEYSLQPFGLYESFDTCPAVLVCWDTTIALQLTQSGLYKFYVLKSPNDVEIDTMIV